MKNQYPQVLTTSCSTARKILNELEEASFLHIKSNKFDAFLQGFFAGKYGHRRYVEDMAIGAKNPTQVCGYIRLPNSNGCPQVFWFESEYKENFWSHEVTSKVMNTPWSIKETPLESCLYENTILKETHTV